MAASAKLREPTEKEKDKIINAARNGNVHTIQQLASSGVDVTGIVYDEDNWTALHWAGVGGHNNIVTFLLSHGARVDDVNWDQSTALHLAARNGHYDTVALLVKNGANVNMKDELNWTALHYAGMEGHNNIVTFLLSHGARVDDVNIDQSTALHLAAESGHYDTVALLVKNGANVNMKDEKNSTPLELAVEEGHSEVAEYFIKNLRMDTTKFNENTQRRIKELLSSSNAGSHDLQQVFDCSEMAKHLKKNLPSLSNLPYKNMKLHLVANDVITNRERKEIDQMVGEDQMAEVLDILQVSLKNKQTIKFKGFLQAMEESGDTLLEEKAESLGGSKSVPD